MGHVVITRRLSFDAPDGATEIVAQGDKVPEYASLFVISSLTRASSRRSPTSSTRPWSSRRRHRCAPPSSPQCCRTTRATTTVA